MPSRFVCAFLFLLYQGLRCSAQLDTGVILGTVLDPSGAVIPNATVLVQNQGTGASSNMTTDASGNFIASALPVGVYRVSASAAGFKTRVNENLRVQVSDRLRVDLTLETGQITERVTVSSEAPVVDTASTTLGAVVTTRQVQDLPVNGRNVMDLLQLVPGAMLRGGANTQSVGGAQLFRSSSGVRFLMDGTDASRVDADDLNNTYGSSRGRISRASIDAIQEFRVYTNSFSAEYGEALGGVVNLITKSGTNDFHGGLFEYFRNEKLDARNYFNVPPAPKPPYRLNQFGGSLGGRLVRDKLFFFGNYEGIRQRSGKTQSTFVPTQAFRQTVVPEVKPAVDMLPLPNGDVSPTDPRLGRYVRNVSDPLTENTGSIKGDYIIGPNDRLSGRYNFNKNLTQTYFGVAQGQVQSAPGFLQIAKINYTRVWSSRVLNETGLAFNRAHIDPRSAESEEIRAFPITALGSGSAGVGPGLFDLRVANTSYTLLETMSYVTGKQQLRFGGQITRNQNNKELSFQKTITHQLLEDFARNSPTSIGTLGQPRAGMRSTYYGLFVQDDIQVNRNLTINAGLRYQYDTSPTESHGRIANFNFTTGQLDPIGTTLINAPKMNLAPRFGIAYTPFASRNTVFRAGYGMFYAHLNSAFAQNVPNNISQQSFSLTSQQDPNLKGFPFPTISSFAGVSNFTALPRDFNTAYTQQWNFNVQQGLGSDSMLQVAYIGNRGLHIDGPARNMNRLIPGTTTRPYPQYGNINLYTDYLNSYYNALQATFRHRMRAGFTFNMNYTWAHSLDNAPTLFASFSDDANAQLDYGNADGDVRHSLQFDYIYELPAAPKIPKVIGSGWQLNGITVMRTGFPITGMSCGCDPLRVGAFTSRPDFVGGDARPANIDLPNAQLNLAAFAAPPTGRVGNLGRNVLKGPHAINFDFSLFKNFLITERQKVEFRAEMFNIFNTPQFANPSGNITAPATFGKSLGTISTSSGFATNRQVQFALRYMF
ncbi:MAG TPA: TonB-dependent receptor [Bryobacteraceae bacterium]|nr:TonB-dependent receptor [Bryobacteraceae bacterium]